MGVLSLGVFTGLTGCDSSSSTRRGLPGVATDGVSGEKVELPFEDLYASPDPEHLTLAIKYVEYVDAAGNPVLTLDEAKRLTEAMNRLYSVCNMHFRAEVYETVQPGNFGLDYNTSQRSDLTSIRAQFDSPDHLLVVHTGSWSSAQMGSANAWTTLPGSTPSGAVVEADVAGMGNLVAHELGHYLNLLHVSSSTNMMNPVIYSNSTYISPSQCSEMRATARAYRSGALRAS